MLFVCMSFCVFFFKQKTAYVMRISDWSSDVCSSDLRDRLLYPPAGAVAGHLYPDRRDYRPPVLAHVRRAAVRKHDQLLQEHQHRRRIAAAGADRARGILAGPEVAPRRGPDRYTARPDSPDPIHVRSGSTVEARCRTDRVLTQRGRE